MAVVGGSTPFEPNYMGQLSNRQQLVNNINSNLNSINNILESHVPTVTENEVKGISDSNLSNASNLLDAIINNDSIKNQLDYISDDQYVPVNTNKEQFFSFLAELANNHISPDELKQFAENHKGKVFTVKELIAEVKGPPEPTGAPLAPLPLAKRVETVVAGNLAPAAQAAPEGGPPRAVGYKASPVVFTASPPGGAYDVIPSYMAGAGARAAEPPVGDEIKDEHREAMSLVDEAAAAIRAEGGIKASQSGGPPDRPPPAPPHSSPASVTTSKREAAPAPVQSAAVEGVKKESLWQSIKKAVVAARVSLGLAEDIDREHTDYKAIKKMEGNFFPASRIAELLGNEGAILPQGVRNQYKDNLNELASIASRHKGDPIAARATRLSEAIQTELNAQKGLENAQAKAVAQKNLQIEARALKKQQKAVQKKIKADRKATAKAEQAQQKAEAASQKALRKQVGEADKTAKKEAARERAAEKAAAKERARKTEEELGKGYEFL